MSRDISYRTRQRELVLSYLKDSGSCLSADEIINGLSESGEPVSKATVYRALERFCGDGSVLRFNGDVGESAVYRYNGEHREHFHIKCTECGTTVCLDCSFMHSMEQHFLNHHGFTVNQGLTVFYGVCAPCREKLSSPAR